MNLTHWLRRVYKRNAFVPVYWDAVADSDLKDSQFKPYNSETVESFTDLAEVSMATLVWGATVKSSRLARH